MTARLPQTHWASGAVALIAALDTGQVRPDTMFNFGEPLRDANGRIYYVYRVGGGEILGRFLLGVAHRPGSK